MTDQAKQKVQELVKKPIFKSSLQKFIQVSEMYTGINQKTPPIDIFKNPAHRTMLKKVKHVDDVYMFRDKNIRFIFTLEEDNKNNPTAILLDVMDKKEAKSHLKTLDLEQIRG